MKILIISYDELNTRPSREQVLSDIRQIYDNTDEKVKEDFGSKLRREITEVITDTKMAEIIFADTTTPSSRNHLESFVQEQAPDLIISYNLAGFELCTLTDSLQYNLWNCRQFHIIKKRQLPNDKYLKKLRSINLFIFEAFNE